jgi:hypothetical protein
MLTLLFACESMPSAQAAGDARASEDLSLRPVSLYAAMISLDISQNVLIYLPCDDYG